MSEWKSIKETPPLNRIVVGRMQLDEIPECGSKYVLMSAHEFDSGVELHAGVGERFNKEGKRIHLHDDSRNPRAILLAWTTIPKYDLENPDESLPR